MYKSSTYIIIIYFHTHMKPISYKIDYQNEMKC
jgi:hypothetical protein